MKVVVFGSKGLSSVAWHALTHDSPHEVVGFTVDRSYLRENTLFGLPVVPFEEVEEHFSPETVAMIVPVGPHDNNGLRQGRHRAAKAKGYRFISYVSSKAVVSPDLTYGENCMIYDGVVVQPFVKLGDGVILRAGALVSHHVEIADNCFVASRACIGGVAKISERCFLGLNATVLDGVSVAARCTIGAGAVVTRDTDEDGVYVGVPAKRRP